LDENGFYYFEIFDVLFFLADEFVDDPADIIGIKG
jgi:hypothetical protein